MNNILYENFKQDIISSINSSQLPIGAVYYIFKDVFQELERTYYDVLSKEAASENSLEEEKKNEEEEK